MMSRIDDLIAQHCPDGVEHRMLRDIAHYSPERVSADSLDESSFVGVDNLIADKGGKVPASYRPNSAMVTSYNEGDVLIGNIRPYLKKIWLADNAGGCSGDVLAVRLSSEFQDRVDSPFLYYVLSSDAFFTYNMQNAKGAKMPRGSKDAILKYRIPLPPLEVQREIVRVLDLFQSLEAELEAELEARRRQYAHYRDSLLDFTERGGVRWMTLGEIAVLEYGFTAAAADEGDLRYVRITDIDAGGKLVAGSDKFVESTPESDRYRLSAGDVLVARTGASFGKSVLIESNLEAVFASFLIRLRSDREIVNPQFLWHFAQSGAYWAQARKLVSVGGQPQFNGNVLSRVVIPVPSLEDQQEIVAILDKFDALVNDLSVGLPAELAARRMQYEYYRDRLLTFEEAA